MVSVPLEFATPRDARRALTAALASTIVSASPSALVGTTCKLELSVAGHTLALFAVVTAAGYRLTDDPSDLRYEINSFLERLPPDETEPAVAFQELPLPVGEGEASGNEEGEKELEEHELVALQSELGSKDPLVVEMKRIKALTLPQKIKLAEDGELLHRTLLFRMYGKLVFDGLLRNPRLTEMEVAKLAKLGTLSVPLLQVIARKTEWLRTERIRNALLANPRTPQAIIQKMVAMISRQELRLLIQRRDFSPAAQVALREQNAKLLKG